MHAKSLQLRLTLSDPMEAPLSKGFSRKEYWSGLPFPSPGDLLDPGIKSRSPGFPALAGGFFTTSGTWEAHTYTYIPSAFGFPSHLGHHRALSACCVTLNKGLNLSEPVFSSIKWEAMYPYSHPCKLNPENEGESPGSW